VELVDLEQPELLERPAVEALARRATFGPGVGESVVEPLVADRRPEQRLELQEPVPIAVEQPVRRGGVVSPRPIPSNGPRGVALLAGAPPPSGVPNRNRPFFELSEPWDGPDVLCPSGPALQGGWCMRSMAARVCALLCLVGFAACTGS